MLIKLIILFLVLVFIIIPAFGEDFEKDIENCAEMQLRGNYTPHDEMNAIESCKQAYGLIENNTMPTLSGPMPIYRIALDNDDIAQSIFDCTKAKLQGNMSMTLDEAVEKAQDCIDSYEINKTADLGPEFGA